MIEASDIVINNNIMIIMLVQKVTPEAINDDMVHNLAHMQLATDIKEAYQVAVKALYKVMVNS